MRGSQIRASFSNNKKITFYSPVFDLDNDDTPSTIETAYSFTIHVDVKQIELSTLSLNGSAAPDTLKANRILANSGGISLP